MVLKLRKKLGVIGVGNMGASILEGLFRKGIIRPSSVWVFDKILEKRRSFARQWKVNPSVSNAELVQRTDIVLLAIKPQDLWESSLEFRAAFRKSHILISILAGTPVKKIKKAVGTAPQIIRAMPNLGAKVGESVTAVTGASQPALKAAEIIFSGCGKTVQLKENYFDLVTAISGSGPAYFFYLMELLVREGMRGGLSEKDARLLAVQTAAGSGKLAQGSSHSPEELRKMVTSKKGTTEAAFKWLTRKSFTDIFSKAIGAARRRGRELSAG